MLIHNTNVEIINRKSKSFHTATLVAGVLSVYFGGMAMAQEKTKEKPVNDESAWTVPSHIQLNPIMIPVEGRRAAPVPVYLEASDKKFVGNICNYVPRLLDAIFRVLTRDPVSVQRNRLVLGGLPQQLLRAIPE